MSSDRIGTSMATNSKAGELSVIFDGLNVDMSHIPTATPTPEAVNSAATGMSLLPLQSNQEGTAINNSTLNGASGNTTLPPNSANSTVRSNGGRSKRNSSGSSQATTDQAIPSSSGRLPPLSSASSDNKPGMIII